jgi:predicted O-methyltransferase YrrM
MSASSSVPAQDRPPRAPGDGFEAVWPLISPIEGWLSREQAMALYEAAGTVAPGRWIVELGSHHGRSTVALAKGKPRSVGLLAVDPFTRQPQGKGDAAYNAFLDNLGRLELGREVQLFRGTSEEAARYRELLFEVAGGEAFGDPHELGRPEIGLLFVDGLHDRNSVLRDIELWEPLIGEGGLVYFHDAFFRLGVTLAVLERHLLNSWFRYLGSVGNLAMFRRERDVGNREIMRGSLRLLGRLGYLGRNVVTTVALRREWSAVLRLLPPEEDFEY